MRVGFVGYFVWIDYWIFYIGLDDSMGLICKII